MKRHTKYWFCLLIALGAAFDSHAQVNLTKGLVAYYPFNGDANDHSGNNNNPTFNNAVPTAGQAGLPATAYAFNGAATYMEIPSSPSFQFGAPITIFARIKPTGYYYGPCHGNNIVSKGLDAEYDHIALRYDDSYYTNFQHCNGTPPDTLHEDFDIYDGAGPADLPYSPFMEKGNWYNVVLTSDGTVVKLYINCVLVVSAPVSPGIVYANGEPLYIGMYPGAGYPYWFNGVVDEIRIYNRAINEAEVHSLSGCPVSPCSPDFTDFSILPSACNPQTIQFAAALPDSIVSAQWILGDGTTASTDTVYHTYGSMGNYPVRLAVQYNSGCRDTVTKVIPFTAPAFDTLLIETKDTTVCAGAPVTLRAAPNAPGYCWTPADSLTGANLADPLTRPTDSTVYYCNSFALGPNLVGNGDFSKGNTGFTSDYFAVSPENSGAEYAVGTSPSAWDAALGACIDHTNGSGNMLMVSGLGQFAKIWSQTVPVRPNTNYQFSVWIESLAGQSPATLNFSINGAVLGAPITASDTTCRWHQFRVHWNSGDSANAVLALVSQNQANGSFFALDDISFYSFSAAYDSVQIKISGTFPVLTIRGDTSICGVANVPLSAAGAMSYSWSPGAGMADSLIADPVSRTTRTTAFVVTGYNSPACAATDTVRVTVLPLPVFTVQPDSQAVCQGNPFTVTAAGGNTYQWTANGSGQAQGATGVFTATAQQSDTISVVIRDSICALNDTLRSIVEVDTVPLLHLAKSNDVDCSMGQARLGVSGGSTYTWTPAVTLTDPASSDPVAAPQQTTWYTVFSPNGTCTAEDSIEVLVNFKDMGSHFSVPSAFTPNGDGINDCFKVQYWEGLGAFELSIYDRYGKRVFYTQNPTACWDGSYNGREQPVGAYVYQIKASSPCAASGYVFRKGTVVLIR
jgi:gliding motility-associated-like protein